MLKEKTKERLLTYVKSKKGEILDTDLSLIKDSECKIKLKCSNNHTWYTTISPLLNQKTWCPYCHGNIKLTEEQYKDRLNIKFGGRISLVGSYENMNTLTTFLCSLHGDFIVTPNSVYNGQNGCEKCSYENRGKHRAKKLEDWKIMFEEVHGKKYDYSLAEGVSIKNQRSFIPIVCPEHGEFKKRIEKHIYEKVGCPLCSKKMSKYEREVILLLKSMNIEFEKEKRFDDYKMYPFDFFIVYNGKSFLIEVDGEHHYIQIPKREAVALVQKRDSIKNIIAQEKGIPLLRIPYTDFKDKDISIKEKIINFLS